MEKIISFLGNDLLPLALSIIGACTGIASLIITFCNFWRSVFKLKVYTKPNLTFLWCIHPCWQNELSHVVLKWMRIVNKSNVPITIFEFEYANMRAFFNTYTEDSLPNPLNEYSNNTFSLPITIPPYGAIEGYFCFRGVGSLPPEGTYPLRIYTSRKTKTTRSILNYDEADL